MFTGHLPEDWRVFLHLYFLCTDWVKTPWKELVMWPQVNRISIPNPELGTPREEAV